MLKQQFLQNNGLHTDLQQFNPTTYLGVTDVYSLNSCARKRGQHLASNFFSLPPCAGDYHPFRFDDYSALIVLYKWLSTLQI